MSADDPVTGEFVPAGPEVLSLRSRFGSTFQGSIPGTFDSVVHAKPIHYLDGQGAWQDIDTQFVPGPDGSLHNAANDLGIVVRPLVGSGGELVHLDLGHGLSLGYGVSGSTPVNVPVPTGNTVTLPEVLPSTSIRLTSQASGVKEDLVLANALAPRSFTYPLYLHGLTAEVDAAGNAVFRDLNGVQRARMPHGVMTDSSVDPASGEPALSTGVTYQIVGAGPTGTALKMTLDADWLADPARTWPVIVDPTTDTYSGNNDDTFVETPYSQDFSADTLLKNGTYDGGTHKARSFIHFNGANVLDSKVINSATVKVFENWSFSCTATPVNLKRITETWAGSTEQSWPGPAQGVLIDQVTTAHGYTGCPNGAYVNFDATTAMRNWADNTWPNYGVALVSPDETDSYQWKKWDSTQAANDPKLVVNWQEPNEIPGQAGTLSVGGNTCGTCADKVTADPTPTLTGNSTDDDGDALQYDFEVFSGWLTGVNANGNASTAAAPVVEHLTTSSFASGTTGTWVVSQGLTDGKYSYRVRAYDGQDYSVWSQGWLHFTVDQTAPATSVSSATHPNQSTWYADDSAALAWSATSESGIKGYSHTLDQTPSTVPDTTAEGTATSLSYSGLPDGLSYLHVRAQNNANIWGPAAHFTLRVDTTAPGTVGGLSTDHTPGLLSTNATINASWDTATDATCGIAGYSYAFTPSSTSLADTTADTTGTSVSSGTLPDGTWWLHVRAIDRAGNAGTDAALGPFPINAAIPEAPAITSATPSTQWTTDRTLRFDWTPPADAFGINGYAVAFDHNPTTALAQTITTTTLTDLRSSVPDGIWYLHVAAVNTAGTWGATANYKGMIDGTAPALPLLTSTTHPNSTSWYLAGSGSVTASSSAVSGINGYATSVDHNPSGDPGTTATSASGSVNFSNLNNGTWYVHVRAISGSGLVSGIGTYTLNIDTAIPGAVSMWGTSPNGAWSSSRTVTINWSPQPSTSGIIGYAVVFDGSPDTVVPHSLSQVTTSLTRSALGDGVYYAHVLPLNAVGTWGTQNNFTIRIDATPPALPQLTSTSHPDQNLWYPTPTGSVTAQSSALSSITGYAISLDHDQTADPA